MAIFCKAVSCNLSSGTGNRIEISDGIAILAIIFSILGIIGQVLWQYRIDKKNEKSSMYKEIYKDIIVHKMPIARQKIVYNGMYIIGYEEMEDLLTEIRRNSYFFEYYDKDFKEKIIRKSQKLEDFLYLIEEVEYTEEEYEKKKIELERELKELYGLVLKKMF